MENEKIYLGFYSHNNKVEIIKAFSSIDYANIFTGNFKNSEEMASAFNLWPQTRFCLLEKTNHELLTLPNEILYLDSETLKQSYIKLITSYDENYNREDVIFWLNNRTTLELKKILNICERNFKNNNKEDMSKNKSI